MLPINFKYNRIAATMHAKINRRKAEQIDIAEIWYKCANSY